MATFIDAHYVIHRSWAGGDYATIQNDTEFQATQYRLTQLEKVVCGLGHELSPRTFADCVQGYILEIQRMREEIDEYLLHLLKVTPSVTDEAT